MSAGTPVRAVVAATSQANADHPPLRPAVGDDHGALDAKQRRAADPLVVEDAPDPGDPGAHQQVREPAPDRAAELVAPQVEDERREALEELDRPRCRRPRRTRRRRPCGGQVLALDVADEVRSDASSSSVARWIRASPLPFSSPIDSSATRGFADAEDALREDRPHSCVLGEVLGSGVRVGPDVEKHERRPSETICTASAGRSTPGSRPSRRTAAAIPAPVWPAVTIASALPRLTRSTATRIEASFFSRRASAGCSSISMTWLAGTISTFGGRVPPACGSDGSSPTRMRWSSGCAPRDRGRRGRPRLRRGHRPSRRPRAGRRCRWVPPARSCRGPESARGVSAAASARPPGGLVVAAVRADAVRQLRLVAVRALSSVGG